MRWFSFAVVLLAATLLEAGNLLNVLAIGGWYIRPSILITLFAYYALTNRTHEAIICTFVIGFAADLAAGVIGPHTVCYGVFGLILHQSNQVIVLRQAIYKVMVVFIVYIVTETAAYWLEILKLHEAQSSRYPIIFFTAIYAALIAPVVWSILSTLSGWTQIKKSKTEWAWH